jgi:hypothetical protein
MMFLLRFVAEIAILTALSLFAILFSGCMAGMGYSTRDRITEAAREYNEGVRWGRLEQAAAHLQKEQRKKFYERHKSVEDELEIDDCEVVSLDLDKSDKKVNRAVARLQYSWILKRVGLLEKTATEQKWEERNGDWLLVSETRTKGSPLMLFDEPARLGAAEAAK